MEQNIESIKSILKEKVIDSISEAFFELNERLPSNSKKYNQLISLSARHKKYKSDLLQGIISQDDANLEHNKIVKAILDFIDLLELEDFVATDAKSSDKRLGKVCFRIAQVMKVNERHDCKVWIAFDEATILEEVKVKLGDDLRDIRVSDTMGVELFDDHDGAAFEIKTYDETVQPIEEDFVTQWNFKVKPLKVGVFPLILKIAVVIERRGKELKKTIVLEEKVSIVSEATEQPISDKEFASPTKSFRQLAVLPFLKPASEIEKPLITPSSSSAGGSFGLRAAMIALIGIAGIFIAYQAINGRKSSIPKLTSNCQSETVWMNIEATRDVQQVRDYLEDCPESPYAVEAKNIIQNWQDSIEQINSQDFDSPERELKSDSISITNETKSPPNQVDEEENLIASNNQEDSKKPTNLPSSPSEETSPSLTSTKPNIEESKNPSESKMEKVTTFENAARKPLHPKCDKKKKQESRESCTEERIKSIVERYIANARIPESSIARVSFIIQKDGKIGSIQIKQSDNDQLSEKIREALEKLPTFKEGRDSLNNPIDVRYFLPVRVQ